MEGQPKDILPTEPMTSEAVLAVLKEGHRQGTSYDCCVDPEAKLSFDTTVADWRDSCDLLEWEELSQAMNDWFAVDFSSEEWRAALTPEKKRTLREVCELLARKAQAVRIESVPVGGPNDLESKAFFAVRELLRHAGADVSNLEPSTPLAPYALKWRRTFLQDIARLKPGALPLIQIDHPVYDRWVRRTRWLFLVYFVGMVVGVVLWVFLRSEFLGACFFSTVLPFLILVHLLGRRVNQAAKGGPKSVTFGNLRTFGDLSRVLAYGEERGKALEN